MPTVVILGIIDPSQGILDREYQSDQTFGPEEYVLPRNVAT